MAHKLGANDAAKRWHRQETRVVRPFRSAEDYLKDVAFRLYGDSEFSASELVYEPAVDAARLLPSLQVSAPPPNMPELVGVSLLQLRLLVSLEDRVLKNTVVAANIPLASYVGGVIELDHGAAQEISWAGETRVHVSVVLDADRKAEIGTAQRAGSWVARKTFTVSKPRDSATFQIAAVDPEYFLTRELPATTTYLVEIQDQDLNQSCENLPDLIKVSLSKEVHAALAKDEDSFMAKALIKSIYVDVVTTVLATGYAGLSSPVEADSILDVVTIKLSKATGVSAEKLQKFASKNSGAELRAIVQAEAELTRAVVSAAQRRAA